MARKAVSFEDYDPNKLPAGLWGVYKGNRLQTYAQRGPALNAFAAGHQSKLYKLGPTGWELLAVKSTAMRGDDCDLCAQSIKASFAYTWDMCRSWQWKRDNYGKIADPPVLFHVCQHCIPVVEAGRV